MQEFDIGLLLPVAGTHRPVDADGHDMKRFAVGDRVRVDIPDTTDPDFDRYHGRKGDVVSIIKDDADKQTGDERDGYLFEVEFTDGERGQFRWRDLRPETSQ